MKLTKEEIDHLYQVAVGNDESATVEQQIKAARSLRDLALQALEPNAPAQRPEGWLTVIAAENLEPMWTLHNNKIVYYESGETVLEAFSVETTKTLSEIVNIHNGHREIVRLVKEWLASVPVEPRPKYFLTREQIEAHRKNTETEPGNFLYRLCDMALAALDAAPNAKDGL